MRIGIDAREIAGRVTGVGRVLASLLREWSADGSAASHEFLLYSPEPIALTLASGRLQARIVPGARGTLWEQMFLARAVSADRPDVFFAPAYTAPIRIPMPSVAAIYDLSYFAHPEWFPLREGIRRRLLTQQTADRARAILTLSEFSRGEVVDRLHVPPARVHVVVPGIDSIPARRVADDEARLLFVGSIFNRRHVPDLVRAVVAVRRQHPSVSLDLVGDNRTFPHEDVAGLIDRLAPDGSVRWHRYVPEDELRELYGRARAFAFLSEYEGLGLTPLEALSAGLPPVLFDTPVARESCGDAALYVAQGDRAGIERAIERALFDEAARSAVRRATPSVLARYDWSRAAREVLTIIEDAAR